MNTVKNIQLEPISAVGQELRTCILSVFDFYLLKLVCDKPFTYFNNEDCSKELLCQNFKNPSFKNMWCEKLHTQTPDSRICVKQRPLVEDLLTCCKQPGREATEVNTFTDVTLQALMIIIFLNLNLTHPFIMTDASLVWASGTVQLPTVIMMVDGCWCWSYQDEVWRKNKEEDAVNRIWWRSVVLWREQRKDEKVHQTVPIWWFYGGMLSRFCLFWSFWAYFNRIVLPLCKYLKNRNIFEMLLTCSVI